MTRYVCQTCLSNPKENPYQRLLSEAEAEIHRSNFPGHEVIESGQFHDDELPLVEDGNLI